MKYLLIYPCCPLIPFINITHWSRFMNLKNSFVTLQLDCVRKYFQSEFDFYLDNPDSRLLRVITLNLPVVKAETIQSAKVDCLLSTQCAYHPDSLVASKYVCDFETCRLSESITRCYQCDKPVAYLFSDSRCKDCTRLTPEEVQGISYSESFQVFSITSLFCFIARSNNLSRALSIADFRKDSIRLTSDYEIEVQGVGFEENQSETEELGVRYSICTGQFSEPVLIFPNGELELYAPSDDDYDEWKAGR